MEPESKVNRALIACGMGYNSVVMATDSDLLAFDVDSGSDLVADCMGDDCLPEDGGLWIWTGTARHYKEGDTWMCPGEYVSEYKGTMHKATWEEYQELLILDEERRMRQEGLVTCQVCGGSGGSQVNDFTSSPCTRCNGTGVIDTNAGRE